MLLACQDGEESQNDDDKVETVSDDPLELSIYWKKTAYYLCKKYITKMENWSSIDNRHTNYCSIMDQYLVWYPLTTMTAAVICGIDS